MQYVWLSLTLMSCSDQGVGGIRDGYGATHKPEIVVTPSQLDYGSMGPGDTKMMTFVVRNEGSEGSVLVIEDIVMDGVASFTLIDDVGETSIPLAQWGSRQFSVAFTPLHAGVNEAYAYVISNDEDEPSVPVRLKGFGLMPELAISPSPYTFDQTMVGCTRDKTFSVANVGTTMLTVTALTMDDGAYTITDAPTLPVHLEPAETVPLAVRFTPDAEGSFDGEVVGASDDPFGNRTGVMSGLGHVPGTVVDRFDLPRNPPVDILFFVDQSGSMEDDQSALQDNFAWFIAQVDDITPDWRVMVVNEEHGCASDVVTEDTPDYVARFAAAVEDGDNGRFSESGLYVAARAMEQTGEGECNDGYPRDDALLHAIMVSDEPEQSPQPWMMWVSRLRELRGDAGLVKISSVVGDIPFGCEVPGNSAEPGIGYVEATVETSGVFLSLCSDWAASIDELARASTTREIFPLSSTPDPATITVVVDGNEEDSGWFYRSDLNAVEFNEDAPDAGDAVEIRYHEPYTCD